MKYNLPLMLSTVSVFVGLHGLALAQEGREHRDRPPAERQAGHLQLDQRYHHNVYYPSRGYAARTLPGGSINVYYRGGQYYFHGGVWFRPVGGRFIVSVPPLGIVVPVLPPAYATLWIGGAPYYYANDVYYAAAPGQGYTVVAPPPGYDTVQPVPPAPATGALSDQIIYPRSGQSAAQMETDRQECNLWAMTQLNAAVDASIFQRASGACMDGRGYTVR